MHFGELRLLLYEMLFLTVKILKIRSHILLFVFNLKGLLEE